MKNFNIILKISLIVELSNGDVIYLKSFPSNKIEEFFSFVKQHNLIDETVDKIHATGGGAFKY